MKKHQKVLLTSILSCALPLSFAAASHGTGVTDAHGGIIAKPAKPNKVWHSSNGYGPVAVNGEHRAEAAPAAISKPNTAEIGKAGNMDGVKALPHGYGPVDGGNKNLPNK